MRSCSNIYITFPSQLFFGLMCRTDLGSSGPCGSPCSGALVCLWVSHGLAAPSSFTPSPNLLKGDPGLQEVSLGLESS